MRSFNQTQYDPAGGRGALAPPPSDYIDARVLAGGTVEVHAIPSGAKFVVFSANAEFYAKFGSSTVTTAVPSADVTDGTAPELNPGARMIPQGATHIALISPAGGVVTLSFYAE